MLSIGVTTFKYRYDKYFVPLFNYLTDNTDDEIIIAINGEHNEKFDNDYRSKILSNIADVDNVYPIIFPIFRGLSKLWNSIVLTATEEYILLLNDDVTINASNFIQHVKACINECQTSFKINGSWSHVVIKKSELMDLGYFDERLLGIGEEDGDFEWRYNQRYGRRFLSMGVPGIINHIDMSHAPTNIKAGSSGKYSKFNRDLLFNGIYTVNPSGLVYGMIDEPLVRMPYEKQYPYETFYKENKDKL